MVRLREKKIIEESRIDKKKVFKSKLINVRRVCRVRKRWVRSVKSIWVEKWLTVDQE